MKKIFLLLVFIIPVLIGCKKIKPNQFEGSWKVTEYAKYNNNDVPEFQEGLPYWFLKKYAQGIQVNSDGSFYHRYSDDNGLTWRTSIADSYGTWELKRKQIDFTIDDKTFSAQILSCKDNILRIKYEESDWVLEYELQKE